MKRIILPEEKLNEWAELISDRLFGSRYFENGVIKGEELKNCTEFSQINKFILFQLFQVVNHQIQRLAHPYFDMEHEEVQSVTSQLKNQLSRHISISEADFKPLLKKAIYNNLKLILDPVETLGNFFFHNQEKISIDTYQKYAPFFSDFDFAVNSIMRYHQKNEMTVVEKDIFFVKLHRVVAIFNNASDQDIETYRNAIIQRLTGRNMDDLVREAQQETDIKRQELARLEAERKHQAEEEQRKVEEEARQKAEEEERKTEEAARLDAERLDQEAAALCKAEEERIAAEEAKKNLFDTLGAKNAFFDIEDDSEVSLPKMEDEVIAVGLDLPSTSYAQSSIEVPSVEVPSVEVPSVEVPSVEVPSVEVPSVEMPSVEMPSVEIPSVEIPSVEIPSVEIPSVEIPSVEIPSVEIPSVEIPSIEIPSVEMPSVEIPSVEMPSVEMPSVEMPSVEVPSVEIPSVEIPSVEIPSVEIPSVEIPSVEIPSVEIPSVEIPSVEIPSVEIPSVEMPSVEMPSVEMPSVEMPSVEIPSVEIPSVEMPSVEIPSVEIPSVEIPSVEIPSVEIPSVEIPSVEIPSVDLSDLRPSFSQSNEEEHTQTVVFQDEPSFEPVVEPKKEEPVLSIFDKFFKKKPADIEPDNEETVILSAEEQQKLLHKETAEPEHKSLVESIIVDAPQDLIHSINAGQKIKLDEIPIHKQYMYVQRVFTGNNVRFRIIVDKANAANTKQEIEEIIDKYILSNPDIRPKDSVVEEFIGILRGRFII